MYKIVITTNDPEALLQTVSHKKYKVEHEVKIQDLEHPQQVLVYDVKDFKRNPLLNLLRGLIVLIATVLGFAGLAIFMAVFVFGLIMAFSQFGSTSLYVIGIALLAIMLWPVVRKLFTPDTVFESASDPTTESMGSQQTVS